VTGVDKYVSANAVNNDYGVTVSPEAHSHDYYEIYCFLGNEATFFLNSVPYILHKHDIVLVKKQMFHGVIYNEDHKKNLQRAYILFNSDFLHKYFDLATTAEIMNLFEAPLLRNIDGSTRSDFISLMLSVCNHFAESDRYAVLKGYHGICMVLAEFLRHANSFQQATSDSSEKSVITQIERYITMNYRKEITLASLAQQFYVNKFYLSRAFKQATGVNVTEFINRKRTDEAAVLLENSDMLITDVASAVGFNSQSYFIEAFKRYRDTTPSKFRVQRKGLS